MGNRITAYTDLPTTIYIEDGVVVGVSYDGGWTEPVVEAELEDGNITEVRGNSEVYQQALTAMAAATFVTKLEGE